MNAAIEMLEQRIEELQTHADFQEQLAQEGREAAQCNQDRADRARRDVADLQAAIDRLKVVERGMELG